MRLSGSGLVWAGLGCLQPRWRYERFLGGIVAEQKKGWFDVVKSSYVWKSMFRHEYQDTYRNRVLQVSSNVFLHLHPTKIRRHALRLRFTWCMGGITFLLFLILDRKSTRLNSSH